MTPEQIKTLPRVRADFSDGVANQYWQESGYLETKEAGFVLHVERMGRLDGTRVFPLRRRTVDVYFIDGVEEALIVRETWPN